MQPWSWKAQRAAARSPLCSVMEHGLGPGVAALGPAWLAGAWVNMVGKGMAATGFARSSKPSGALVVSHLHVGPMEGEGRSPNLSVQCSLLGECVGAARAEGFLQMGLGMRALPFPHAPSALGVCSLQAHAPEPGSGAQHLCELCPQGAACWCAGASCGQ